MTTALAIACNMRYLKRSLHDVSAGEYENIVIGMIHPSILPYAVMGLGQMGTRECVVGKAIHLLSLD
jgi:hypothetical protein